MAVFFLPGSVDTSLRLLEIAHAVESLHPQKEQTVEKLKATVSGTDNFIAKAKRYTGISELTSELLRLFIEKVVVHEKDVKWSKHARQTVEIHYTDIGVVDALNTVKSA